MTLVTVRAHTRKKPVNPCQASLHDELALEPIFKTLEREISDAMDNLRAQMDQSDGLTPEMIAAEFPEFFNDDFRSTMGLPV
jgi:hypothetical protein